MKVRQARRGFRARWAPPAGGARNPCLAGLIRADPRPEKCRKSAQFFPFAVRSYTINAEVFDNAL